MRTRRSVRREHRDAVMHMFLRDVRLTRQELAAELGIARSTLSETVDELIQREEVHTTADRIDNGRGRPAEVMELNLKAVRYLGIDLSHAHAQILYAAAPNLPVQSDTIHYDSATSWEYKIRTVINVIDRQESNGVDMRPLRVIALGLPGPFAAELHTNSDRPLSNNPLGNGAIVRDALQAKYTAPVIIDHHLRFAALAEAQAIRPRHENLIYIRISYGVGGALIVDGQTLKGATRLAGELGHMQIDGPEDARPCRCGSHGCLETRISTEAILQDVNDGTSERVEDVREITTLLAAGDRHTKQVVSAAANTLGRALSVISAVSDPAVVVLAGEGAAPFDDYVEQIQSQINRRPVGSRETRLHLSHSNELAAAEGAVLSAHESYEADALPDHH